MFEHVACRCGFEAVRRLLPLSSVLVIGSGFPLGSEERFVKHDEAVEGHLYLVYVVARRLHSRYQAPFGGLELSDLVAWGTRGLIEAFGRFDKNRAISFRVFAYPRIHGAIIDGLRQMGGLSRAVCRW